VSCVSDDGSATWDLNSKRGVCVISSRLVELATNKAVVKLSGIPSEYDEVPAALEASMCRDVHRGDVTSLLRKSSEEPSKLGERLE